MNKIPEGYGFIAGRGRETAQAALAAAEKAELEPSAVRTVQGGFVVPAAVLEVYEADNFGDAAEPAKRSQAATSDQEESSGDAGDAGEATETKSTKGRKSTKKAGTAPAES